MTAYEPGTVCVASVRGVPNLRVMRRNDPEIAWLSVEHPGGTCHHRDEHVTDVRPLVVLDLDALRGCWADTNSPAAIVERLRETNSVAAHAIADQIEAQTRPPKPPEPTGLGAVVEDAAGVKWTRVEFGYDTLSRNPWYPADCEDQPAEWSEIDAVRVLSEGVQP